MKYEPIFNAPEELNINGTLVTNHDLRLAIEDNDLGIIQPLIDLILFDAGNKRTDSEAFAFLIIGIRPIIRTAIAREFGTYSDDNFPDFFLGALTAIWIKLPDYDPKLSKFSTFVYRLTRDGNRSFTRNSERFYEACRRFNANPAAVIQDLAVSYSRKLDDYVYEESGIASVENMDLSEKRIAAIAKIWNNLDVRTAQIIKLHLIENKTPKEVADILGPPLNENTVYEYIKRAINKVRIAVNKEYDEKRDE